MNNHKCSFIDISLIKVEADSGDERLSDVSGSVGEDRVAENKTAEKEVSGPVGEDKALEELKSLSKDLQAIRLHVDKQLGQSQSSEEWVQVGFVIDRLLFGLYILFISVSFVTIIIIWLNSYRQ